MLERFLDWRCWVWAIVASLVSEIGSLPLALLILRVLQWAGVVNEWLDKAMCFCIVIANAGFFAVFHLEPNAFAVRGINSQNNPSNSHWQIALILNAIWWRLILEAIRWLRSRNRMTNRNG